MQQRPDPPWNPLPERSAVAGLLIASASVLLFAFAVYAVATWIVTGFGA